VRGEVEEAKEHSLDDIIREQDARPVDRLEDLQGADIDDFDEFLATVRSVRGR
jgi:hypothetical protein